MLWLIIGRLYLSILHLFHTCFHSPPLWQPLVCSLYLWGFFLFCLFAFLFFKIPHINENIQYFVLLCLTNFALHITLQFHPCFVIGNISFFYVGFPCGLAGEESACNAGDLGSSPGLGRSPGEGKGYSLQYSGLENSMNFIVHGVAKGWTWLSGFHFHVAV